MHKIDIDSLHTSKLLKLFDRLGKSNGPLEKYKPEPVGYCVVPDYQYTNLFMYIDLGIEDVFNSEAFVDDLNKQIFDNISDAEWANMVQQYYEPRLDIYLFIKSKKMPVYDTLKRNILNKILLDVRSKLKVVVYIYFHDEDYHLMGASYNFN